MQIRTLHQESYQIKQYDHESKILGNHLKHIFCDILL